jgi:nucleoside phosphorylase
VANTQLKPSDLKGKVHAAIITIRIDEDESMEARLGPAQSVAGNNTYKYAQIPVEGGLPVSVVLTRVVGQGNTKAQAVASNIINELDPAWLFLVGIAGGVPDNEFSLGDVVLATRLHDFSFTAAREGDVRTQGYGGNMHQEVERFLSTRAIGADGTKLRQLAGFDDNPELLKHPDVYSADISPKKRYYGSDSHKKKVKSTIERRFREGKRKGGPTVWQGPCANGNLVLKDAGLLASWQTAAIQVVQVETELAGVYEAASRPIARSWSAGNRAWAKVSSLTPRLSG